MVSSSRHSYKYKKRYGDTCESEASKKLRRELKAPHVHSVKTKGHTPFSKTTPPNWSTFANRSIVYETHFDLVNILSHHPGSVQLINFPNFCASSRWNELLTPPEVGYDSLTRLFYAGIVPKDELCFSISVGGFKADITPQVIASALKIETARLGQQDYLSWPLNKDVAPSQASLSEFLFIDGTYKRHHLKSYDMILFHIISHSNILPSTGNKNDITHQMALLIYCAFSRHISLAVVIFRKMLSMAKGMGDERTSLPFPCTITTILLNLGYKIPKSTAEGKKATRYDRSLWRIAYTKGMGTRIQAFLKSKTKLTSLLIVGGSEPDPEDKIDAPIFTALDTLKKQINKPADADTPLTGWHIEDIIATQRSILRTQKQHGKRLDVLQAALSLLLRHHDIELPEGMEEESTSEADED